VNDVPQGDDRDASPDDADGEQDEEDAGDVQGVRLPLEVRGLASFRAWRLPRARR
jgi:hypothetical protein